LLVCLLKQILGRLLADVHCQMVDTDYRPIIGAPVTVTYEISSLHLTLPYLRGGQVVTPAQRWGRISSAQCATPM